MARKRRTTDRTARLLKVEHLLYQAPAGLKVEEIARRCSVTKRTTYRDLQALESEVGIPIWEEGTKRGIVKGHYLPPIRFTLPEALNIFLAARLMLSYANRYDPNIDSTFMKLNSVVPDPLKEQIQRTIDWMQKQPKDDKYLGTLATLAEAWVSQKQVKISYRALHEDRPKQRTIEPYFIEPAAPGHSSYVLAHCHLTNSLRTFKIERIEGIETTSEPYAIPSDFDANAYLSSAWGIFVEGEVKAIRLRFAPDIARLIEETIWHPSQVLERQGDGSMVMTLRVTDTVELRSWILGWGANVEVLEPEELRQETIETATAMLQVYRQG